MAAGSQRAVSLLMVDIDHFKHLNDTQGHLRGDAVLREVARTLKAHTRAGDWVCRYGGEEFAVILPGTEAGEAVAIAHRIRKAVQGLHLPGCEGQPGGCLTVSVGVAVYPDDARTARTLVESADRALYAAKKAGRNAVRRDSRQDALGSTPPTAVSRNDRNDSEKN